MRIKTIDALIGAAFLGETLSARRAVAAAVALAGLAVGTMTATESAPEFFIP